MTTAQKKYKGQKTHRKITVRPITTDENYFQQVVFTAYKPCQHFNKINTLSVYNDNTQNKIMVTFKDGNEIIKRELKVKHLNGQKRLHITYNNEKYLLASRLTKC